MVNMTKAAGKAGVNKHPWGRSSDRAHDQKRAGLWAYKPQTRAGAGQSVHRERRCLNQNKVAERGESPGWRLLPE